MGAGGGDAFERQGHECNVAAEKAEDGAVEKVIPRCWGNCDQVSTSYIYIYIYVHKYTYFLIDLRR